LVLDFFFTALQRERRRAAHTHKTGSHMASILPFIRDKSDFDDEATRLMGEAFDAACKGLRDTGQPIVVQEVIAKRIIKAAMKGERDPARLRAAGLAALGYDREAI
jgi:hypothetical protein